MFIRFMKKVFTQETVQGIAYIEHAYRKELGAITHVKGTVSQDF